ncbi:MAG: large subunit ribosomal protein [Chlamydiota bacterium]|jgi:large subunit ribosomal protein L1|nr:large subunit ribosomal protein [Chlamydiota bacterium]
MHRSKRFREIASKIKPHEKYDLTQAIEILKNCPPIKFDQSVELSLKTGVDAQKPDQQVRGTVSLPNGTGKQTILVVFAKGEKIQEALDAGADYAGNEELFEKIKKGWTSFDVVIATPDMMRDLGKYAKILGPRGLMPTPKAGTVTNDIAGVCKQVKMGRIEFKIDKQGVINTLIGKLSFSRENLIENITAFINAIVRAKPSSAKGQYIQSIVLSSTMGPGLKVDLSVIAGLQGAKEQ